MTDAQLILVAGALILAGLGASLAADRLKVPGLVLFLGLGMAIGSDGAGWIEFNDYELARTLGIIGLSVILFEGGLSASWSEIRPVLPSALSLALVGTLITAAIAGLAATWLFDLTLLEGMLLGSIVSATDGAAIFSLLRGSRLKRRVTRTLEAEAGFNDPVAVLLVVGLIDWIELPSYGFEDMVLGLGAELFLGAIVGLAVGWVAIQGLRRIRLRTESAYVIGTLAVAAIAYGAASTVHGSGFLAVYLAGLSLGSAAIPAQRAVTVFHQGMASLAQVAMFLVLGLLVFPGELAGVALEGTVLALILVLVARPVATLVATSVSSYDMRERTVLAWAGLRGAVPVVLATFPVIAGVNRSVEFFNIVFFAVLLSTLAQGASFEALARRLGMLVHERAPAQPSSRRRAGSIAQISVMRPWSPDDGDPGFPNQVGQIGVVEQLATRIDRPGALVALEDGRYAISGKTVAIGSASALQRVARSQLLTSTSRQDRAWWREVIGALAR